MRDDVTEHRGGDEQVSLPANDARLRLEPLVGEAQGVARAEPLLLLDVLDGDALELGSEVRPHLFGAVPDHQRQPVVGYRSPTTGCQLQQRVLEERSEADRVHALLQVGTKATESRAVPGREADEVHGAKVNTYH